MKDSMKTVLEIGSQLPDLSNQQLLELRYGISRLLSDRIGHAFEIAESHEPIAQDLEDANMALLMLKQKLFARGINPCELEDIEDLLGSLTARVIRIVVMGEAT